MTTIARLKRALVAVESAESALKRARTDDVHNADIARALREVQDAQDDIKRAMKELRD